MNTNGLSGVATTGIMRRNRNGAFNEAAPRLPMFWWLVADAHAADVRVPLVLRAQAPILRGLHGFQRKASVHGAVQAVLCRTSNGTSPISYHAHSRTYCSYQAESDVLTYI